MPHIAVGTQVIILAATALHRHAWNALLAQQPGIEVWGMAASQDDLTALPEPSTPTTVFIDFPNPSPEFVSRIIQVKSSYSHLVLVNSYDLVDIVTLLQVGVVGCLSRDATVADLARALIAVGRGEIVLPPTLAAKALTALARGKGTQKQPSETITDRESDVLALLAKGMTNKDIAQTLFLSVRTVEAHLRNIYGKLGVASRTEAVLWAIKHG